VIQTDAIGNQTSKVLVCPSTSDLSNHLPVRPTLQANSLNGIQLRSQFIVDKTLFNGAALARSSGGWTHRLTKQLDCALMVVLGLAR
jgi:mRNA interferase MazF